MGLEFSNPDSGLLGRSKRYALLAEDGVVRVLNLETSRTERDERRGDAAGESDAGGGEPATAGAQRPRGSASATARSGSAISARSARPAAPRSSAARTKSRGSSGARGIAPSATPQSMVPAKSPSSRASLSSSCRRARARGAAEVGLRDAGEEARVHAVAGHPPPGDGDELAQHRLERPVGVERLERVAGAGGPVGGEPREHVVLRGEVAVDRALGVFGALGDRLDGHRLPVVAVEERHGGVEQARSRRSSSRVLRALVPIGVSPRDLRSRDTAAAVVNRS